MTMLTADPPPAWREAIAYAAGLADLVADEPLAVTAWACIPRDIELIVTLGLGIPVLRRERLHLRDGLAYLAALGATLPAETAMLPDRRLYGLLHIGPPMNLVLVDAGLGPAETSAVLAHEAGHLLGDIVAVLAAQGRGLPDLRATTRGLMAWQRPATSDRLAMALRGRPALPTAILRRYGPGAGTIGAHEERADLIAREILAPWAEAAPLAAGMGTVGLITHDRTEALAAALIDRFALPARLGRIYAAALAGAVLPRPSPAARLLRGG